VTEITQADDYMHQVRLASRVTDWWHHHGFINVHASVHRVGDTFFGIKSNLRNGLPPGATPNQVAQAWAMGRARRG
jgi:hypothetical protein